ncbi:sugar ABC transporter substrate-binding protein [Sphaerisporangium siamense]|uniref:Multiple sugar transport system substrate-binding protein n=1 Tax=Sphaerisporangium siamense TaxID=795645 RepID=A0A7W7GC78_9ACTN|nr:ABC transporter substrate-binding protein [Sphaerisporangium siamense]MBB4703600.1 multiple sugar transport system substrate-binding protein [Sphaerisporangium siamense]GII82072.1 sugar ABC transporter substrate-binding protein [Sphaerisporangium siamense]
MRSSLLLAAAAGLAVLASAACTAGNETAPGVPSAGSTPNREPVTITMWHGFSADNELKAFDDALAGFRAKYPWITVKTTKAVQDDQIIQSVRGGNPPDVALSFTTDSVATFCKTGLFQDLAPYLSGSRIDTAIFPKVIADYTEYQGKRCVMPMLADTYGLYYNKKLMKGAPPPKTLSELADLAKKLTVRDKDGAIKVAGFNPSAQMYENVPIHTAPMTGAKWTNPDGTSAIGGDPAWKQFMTWQKDLVDWFGYDNLEKFRKTFGDEFSADNPFMKGRVAMAIDGEWRNAMLAADAPGLEYGTAPLPVADDKPQLYGGGFIAGTVIGIPRGAQHNTAAWELVKYLTTDTDALVTLSNAIRNVPSTLPALQSPKLDKDPNFQTFLDIFANPASTTLPAHINSAFNQQTLQEAQEAWESGRATDLDALLAGVDKKINDKLKLTAGG